MKAVIYIRWSSAEQAQGDSERRQRALCEAFVERQGWTLADVITEDGKSAFRGANRAAGSKLAALEARYDAGEFDGPIVLVTERLDRLSRQDAKSTFRWIDALTLKGVWIATENDGRVYNQNNLDMIGMITMLLEADVAHKQSLEKSKRIGLSWAAKRDAWMRGEGTPDARIAPDWVSVVDQTPAPAGSGRKARMIGGRYALNEKVEIVRRLVTMSLDHGMGINLIATKLNKEGARSLRGSFWTPANIARTLRSRALIGEYLPQYKSEDGSRARAEGAEWIKLFPAAITEERFYALQATIAGRRHLAGRKREANNLLQGLGHCERCGGPMAFRQGGKGHARDKLQCRSYRFGMGCTAEQKYDYPALEKAVLDLILPLALDPAFLGTGATENSLDGQLLALEAKLENKRQAARDLAAVLDTNPSRTIVEKVAAMDAEIDRLEVERAALSQRIAETRGKVTNAEHLRKVAEVRAIATMVDEYHPERAAARRRIQQAFADLIEDIRFFPTKRRIGIKLIGDARVIALDLEGRVGLDLDWMKGGHVTAESVKEPFKRASLRNYERRRDQQKAA